MSFVPFRFLHSGDFRLGQPITASGNLPDRIAESLLEAPYLAAQRVVDTALAEQVAFVVLCGDVIDPHHCPARALAFFVEQMERLDQQKIPVYWAGSKQDGATCWPDVVQLPENVQRFSANEVETVNHYDREGPALATILGVAGSRQRIRAGDFRADDDDLPVIALACGDATAANLTKQSVNYWALGGRSRSKTLCSSPVTAHYAGTPQGRLLSDGSASGCTVVDMTSEEEVRLQRVATDTVRLLVEEIEPPRGSSLDELQHFLVREGKRISDLAAGRQTVVTWQLRCSGSMARQMRDSQAVTELLERVRRELGRGSDWVWPAAIQRATSTVIPEAWRSEETILGDYLRTIHEHQKKSEKRVSFHSMLRTAGIESPLSEMLAGELSQEEQAELLQEAASLGADLLGGDDSLPRFDASASEGVR